MRNPRLYRSLSKVLKGLLLLFALIFIYEKVFKSSQSDALVILARDISDTNSILLLLAACLLIPINWGLEALKWRMIVMPFDKIKFMRALKGVLSGVTTSLVFPNRIGEFLGRIAHIDFEHRWQGFAMSLLGSTAQLGVTLSFGGIAYILFEYFFGFDPFSLLELNFLSPFKFVIIISIGLTAFLFVYPRTLKWIISRLFRKKFGEQGVNFLDNYDSIYVSAIILLSILRYLVFWTQYMLVFTAFGAEMTIAQGMILIPLLFLAIAATPSFSIGEIGIREFYALALVSTIGLQEISIIGSTLLIWVLNIFLPSLFGWFYLWKARIFPED